MISNNSDPRTMQLFSGFKSPSPGHLLAKGGTVGFGVMLIGFALLVVGLPLAMMISESGHLASKVWILGGFGTIVISVGIYLLGLRDRLEIDQRGIHYVHKRWSKITDLRAPLHALKAVQLRARVERSDKSTYTRYLIGLHIDAPGFPKYLELGKFAAEHQARGKAGELARAVNAKLQDSIGDQLVELDPRSGREIETAEERRREREAAAKAGTQRFEINSLISDKRAGLYMALGAFLLFDLVIALVVVAVNVDLHSGFGIGMLTIVALVPGAALLWFIFARTTHQRIEVDDMAVTCWRELAGTRFMQRRIPITDIRTVRGQTKSADGRGVAIVTGKRRWLLASGATDDTIAGIAQAIDQRF